METDLRGALADMSQFISVEVGESFSGVYKGFKRVPNRFDAEKESIELYFDVAGKEKSMTSMSLPNFLVSANVTVGDYVTVTKASKKGNTIVWAVVKSKAPAQAAPAAPAPVSEADSVDLGNLNDLSEEQPVVTDEDLAKAGL